ncbi:hypothetical protein [Ketobacter sp.]|uniref:hypothetical protein n=1 Tax=Ketobacter sp. TaxID=2083498 RepID=UPI000F1E022D|nr:hypothetical protein [Ketobacter sp.]RLU01217.1 MAG: hypothetical protein D9N14_03400 [Ketobacter sp.]
MSTIVFFIVLLGIILIWYFSKSKSRVVEHNEAASNKKAAIEKPKPVICNQPDKPIAFGYKTIWVAIKATDSKRVIECLDMHDVEIANWETGIVAANHSWKERLVFVSPPVKSWVFVVGGMPCLDRETDPDVAIDFIKNIASHFSDVQYFGSHRVSGWCAWARIIENEMVRAYSFGDGETLRDTNDLTMEEIELDLKFLDTRTQEFIDSNVWEIDDHWCPDEEDVTKLAGKWSLNPAELDELELPESVGFVGKISSKWDQR